MVSAHRRPVSLITAAIVFAMVGVTGKAAAQNPFNINGVTPDAGVPGTVDPDGSTKELGPVNSSTTKVGVINTAPLPMLAFTNPNGQVDLSKIWLQTKVGADHHEWLYFAWQRDANTGSGFIAFEFQQAAVSPTCVYTGSGIDMILPQSPGETSLINTCNPWANRQTGDFMILWDQSGSALAITKRVYASGIGFGPPIPLGTAVAAIGSCDGVPNSNGFCGEAAIDLTVDVFNGVNGCLSFANIIPGTVTGNSDSADYKDTVFAAFQPISNCGTVKVVKATTPAGQTGTFPFTLARSSGNVKFDGTPSESDTLTSDGDFRAYADLITASNYTLVEGTVSSPWALVSIICVQDGNTFDVTPGGNFDIVPGGLTVCTITNHRRQGNLQVIKHVVNNFGGTATASSFTISLGDSAATTFPGMESPGVVSTFDEGYAFNVGEIGGPNGYVLLSKTGTCSGAIIADTTQTCTLTNTDVAPLLTVIKHVINDNGGTATANQWTMNVTANKPSLAAFAGVEAPGVTVTVSAGAYSVAESGGPSGYLQVSAVGCSGTLAVGQTATCTITNDDQQAHLTVIKHVINDNGGTATAAQWTMNVAATRPSLPSFAGAEAPGVTITLDAGAFSVAESGGPGGTVQYIQTSAVGCTGTIAVGGNATCTITNDDQKATPTGATTLSWILRDAAAFTVRSGAPDAASATVTFKLFGPNDATCSTAPIDNETLPATLANNSAAAAAAGVLRLQSQVGTYRWVAIYSGDQYNSPAQTGCGDEAHTITFPIP